MVFGIADVLCGSETNMHWLSILAGVTTLAIGGDLLVRGAARLARSYQVSPLVIGLTVVAFGTSSPELFVSVQAALEGNSDIAVSNVVGSNIFNVFFILGVSSLIVPLSVSLDLIRQDVPITIILAILLLAFAFDGHIGRLEGIALCGGLAFYTWFTFRRSRKADRNGVEVLPARELKGCSLRSRLLLVVMVGFSIGLLSLGAKLLVDGASSLAERLGIADIVIGLTLVSAGTSLPEVATSVMAAIRRQRDIAVGNVVGSNIFNILGVLGATSLLAPASLQVAPSMLWFDIPVLVFSSVLCLPIFFTGITISRVEGVIFLVLYVAYTGYLILTS